MKRIATICLFVGMLLFIAGPAVAQEEPEEGDYQTFESGDWNDAAIWDVFNGGDWEPADVPPSGSETITVLEGDSVHVNVEVTITGRLVNQGRVESNDNLTIGDGGIYQHDRNAGNMPIAVWAEGSTLLMTGITTDAPADRNQSYYNVVFDTPDLLSNLNMDLDDVTIGGDIRVVNSHLGRWYLTSAPATESSTITIMGDVYVEGGAFSVHGTSNAQTTFVVHHYGNVIVTGGNFSISRGGQGGGTTTWYLYEGDFSMSNATTQSSTTTPGGAKFVFAGEDTQRFTLGGGNTLTALPVQVSDGAILDIGSSEFAGGGMFEVVAGATLATSHPGGLEGNLGSIEAEVILDEEANFIFNGDAAQITSTLMPTVVNDLTIDNEAGVTLSQETTINGVLLLSAGVFDNTIPFELGPDGSIVEDGGSLLHPYTSVEEFSSEIPQSFYVDQNYPNPFNPSTVIRFGLPSASFVSVKLYNLLGQEVITLFEGDMNAGTYEIPLDASNLSSGAYLYRVQAGDNITTKRMMLIK
jgi:hypothetical protein